MSELAKFLKENENFLSEEIKLLYFLYEKPHRKVCVIEGIASSVCEAGKSCRYAERNKISDPVKDNCKYWIEIQNAEQETKEEIKSNFKSILIKRRPFKR